MPRIPVRIEPYTSPSRQHRHFKNKRDQVLRALGKAAYINGSHFAIMWVSARGDVETYASEALQDRLEDWFTKSGISDEAKQLVIGAQGNPRANPFKGDDQDENDDDLSEDESGLMLQVPGASNASQSSSSLNTPVLPSEDVFGDKSRLDGRPVLQRSASTSIRGRKSNLALDTSVANEQYIKGREDMQIHSAIEGQYMHGLGLDTDEVPHSAPLRMPLTASKRSANSTQQHVPQFETRLNSLKARTEFLELRFSQLQQGMCKTVAKAWIKIIEPKKQTRCPYNKGEEGKPTWWPEGVRHKEPDHLMKPERHSLLLTILRSPKIQVARLQLATAEVVALIKADKVSLLMDVYRIAREEEKMREAGIDMDTPMTVGVSTLDGWSEADQAVTTERGGSPDAEEQEPSGGSSCRKRSSAMARSASASTVVKSNKRKLSAVEASSSPSMRQGEMLDVPRSAHRGSSWMVQEATQNSMKKMGMHSPSMANAGQFGTQQQQSGLEQHYGLLTPMTGPTQLMDHPFLQPKESNGGMVPGYMSAPQPSHAQLFPHNDYQFQNAQQQQQHYNIHTTRDASNLFAYQQQRVDGNNDSASTSQSALGLQGIHMHWANSGFNQDFANDPNNSQNQHWWHQQQAAQQHQQQQHHQQQQQQPQKDASNGDHSFDTSFASTVDSAGPATPPLGGTPLQRSASQSKLNTEGNIDYMQQHQQQFAEKQQQQGHRNPYNLSLAKVPTTYETWSYQS
jgi:hypothetical protein